MPDPRLENVLVEKDTNILQDLYERQRRRVLDLLRVGYQQQPSARGGRA